MGKHSRPSKNDTPVLARKDNGRRRVTGRRMLYGGYPPQNNLVLLPRSFALDDLRSFSGEQCWGGGPLVGTDRAVVISCAEDPECPNWDDGSSRGAALVELHPFCRSRLNSQTKARPCAGLRLIDAATALSCCHDRAAELGFNLLLLLLALPFSRRAAARRTFACRYGPPPVPRRGL
jgi:hypothetical protein